MGNGPRLKPKTNVTIDIESGGQPIVTGTTLTLDDLEKAAAAMVANFGQPNHIFLPSSFTGSFMTMGGWENYPEYTGTPWANTSRITKRERAVAGLHATLNKLDTLRGMTDHDWEDVRYKSIRRLKKAKWARYQQKKVQSSP